MARNIAPQDVSWFLDLNKSGRLDLSPPYQRRSVWTPKDRRFFLDTVFNRYPCPPVFLYKSLSDEGVATYHVVDGKQRLETIINFADNKIALGKEFPDGSIAGRKWRSIPVEYKKDFWNYQLAVEMLEVVDAATVKEIFDRYNRTSKNLERQELRHARFDGWFISTVEEEAKKAEWRQLKIVTTAQARRMRDVQFLSELMLVVLKKDVFGFDQDALDDLYAEYDTPQETDPAFAEEEVIVEFEKAKQWVMSLEQVNGAVSEHGKSYTNFYSLWCVAALADNGLPKADVAAERYAAFMSKVNEVLKTEDPESLLGGDRAEALRGPYRYAQNARGASTEPPQRRQRYEVLRAVLLGNEVPKDEDHDDDSTPL
jgi:hypothetical protein